MSVAKILKLREYNTKILYHDNTNPTDLSGESFHPSNRSKSCKSLPGRSPIRFNDTFRSTLELGYEDKLESRKNVFNKAAHDSQLDDIKNAYKTMGNESLRTPKIMDQQEILKKEYYDSLKKGGSNFDVLRPGMRALSCTPNTKKISQKEQTAVFNESRINYTSIKQANRGDMIKKLLTYDDSMNSEPYVAMHQREAKFHRRNLDGELTELVK